MQGKLKVGDNFSVTEEDGNLSTTGKLASGSNELTTTGLRTNNDYTDTFSVTSSNGSFQAASNKFTVGQDGAISAGRSGDGNYTFTVDSGGNVSATQIELTSDIRLKTDIEVSDSNACLAAIGTLDSLTYTLPHSSRRLRGVSAQSVREVLPEAVSGDEQLSVDYAGLTSALCGAVNALRTRVETLEAAT